MKILRQGQPQTRVSPTPAPAGLWVGKTFCCGECDALFTLEEGDTSPTFSPIPGDEYVYLHMKCPTENCTFMLEYARYCDECGVSVEVGEHLSDCRSRTWEKAGNA